jgi:amino acid adenylation domain-containing protein
VPSPETFSGFLDDGGGQTVHQRFESHVATRPDQPAVRSEDQELTYDELNRAANRLARMLLARGDDRGEPVALLLGQNAQTIVGMIAVLKTGACYTVLDPSFSPHRLAGILAHTGAWIILTNTPHLALASDVASSQHTVVNLDTLETGLSDENPDLPVAADAPAAIYYTSGSTGQPKGILWNHRSLLHHVWSFSRAYGISRDDRIALLATLTFIASVSRFMAALLNGATLCLYNVRHSGIADLATWLPQERITVFHPPVTLLHRLLDILPAGSGFPDLRMVILGGEALSKRDVERSRKHVAAHCMFAHQLATTETKVIARFMIDRDTELTDNVVPVGYASDDKQVVLLDATGQEVGVNRVGEIAVKSRYLASGYWRDPALTDDKFLPDPAGGDERLYRTGDLGIMAVDGCLKCLGRADHQVKIRGHRVELNEVEFALQALPGVKEAVVAAQETPSGGKRLVAYVVSSLHPAPSITVLRHALARALPDYMLPAAYVTLEQLPRTATGKVDRQALPAPDQARPRLANAYVAPRGMFECQLTEMWEKLFEIQPVGVRDNFFDLGGDSLVAAHLLAEIEQTFGRRLEFATLARVQTVEDLASLLGGQVLSAARSSLVPLQPEGTQPAFFCVPPAGQTVLIFTDLGRQLAPDQPFYGLQPLGMDGKHPPHDRVEVMAAHYIREIRTLQPQGPYFLGGMCFGGTVAFEMAQQLTAAGQHVGLLALFDPLRPPIPSPSRKSLRDHVERFVYYWQIDQSPRTLARRTRDFLTRAVRRRPPRLFDDVFVAHQTARKRYVPQVYSGPITLFVTRETERPDDHRAEWSRLTSAGVETVPISGAHNGRFMRAPLVGNVAEQLRAALCRAPEASQESSTEPEPQAYGQ